MAGLRQLYSVQSSFRLFFDGTKVGWVPLNYVKKQVQFMKENDTKTMQYVEKVAIVVKNDVARQLVKLIFTLKRPSAPVRVFDRTEDAWKWVIGDTLEGAIARKSIK